RKKRVSLFPRDRPGFSQSGPHRGNGREGVPSFGPHRFPRAIFADLRFLNETNRLRWWLRDRKRFRREMLRVVSNVLTVKSAILVTFEDLSRRDRMRSRLRMPVSATTVFVVSLVLFVQ